MSTQYLFPEPQCICARTMQDLGQITHNSLIHHWKIYLLCSKLKKGCDECYTEIIEMTYLNRRYWSYNLQITTTKASFLEPSLVIIVCYHIVPFHKMWSIDHLPWDDRSIEQGLNQTTYHWKQKSTKSGNFYTMTLQNGVGDSALLPRMLIMILMSQENRYPWTQLPK